MTRLCKIMRNCVAVSMSRVGRAEISFAVQLATTMDSISSFVLNQQVKVKKLFTTNLDYRFEFEIIEFAFRVLSKFNKKKLFAINSTNLMFFNLIYYLMNFIKGFNFLDANVLESKTSKCRVVYFFVLLTFSALNVVKNITVDLAGDFSKQCATLVFFTGLAQVLNCSKSKQNQTTDQFFTTGDLQNAFAASKQIETLSLEGSNLGGCSSLNMRRVGIER